MIRLATIGRRYYWSHTSGRSVRLYTGECVVDSSTGLWDRAPSTIREVAKKFLTTTSRIKDIQRGEAITREQVRMNKMIKAEKKEEKAKEKVQPKKAPPKKKGKKSPPTATVSTPPPAAE